MVDVKTQGEESSKELDGEIWKIKEQEEKRCRQSDEDEKQNQPDHTPLPINSGVASIYSRFARYSCADVIRDHFDDMLR